MKINVRSYQRGGGLKAAIYQPVTVTPTSTTAQYAINLLNGSGSTAATKSSGSDGKITEKDLYTGLYKTIAEQGLQSDTAAIIQSLQTELFNDSLLDPFGDTSDLSNKYLKALSYVNMAKGNQKEYDEAYQLAVSKDSLQENAVTTDGKLVVKTQNEEITTITPEEYRKNQNRYQALTNGNLLAERNMNPKYAFQNGLLQTVKNGTSSKEIYAIINTAIANLGNNTNDIYGYTSVQQQQIQKGISLIQTAALKYGPQAVLDMVSTDGLYKVGIKDKNQQNQVQLALDSLFQMLSPAQQTLLKVKSPNGTNKGAYGLLAQIIGSHASSTFEFNPDLESGVDANGNKVGKSASSSGSKDEAEINDAERLLYGMNEPETLTFGYGNATFTAMGRKSQISTYQGESLGAEFSYKDMYKAQVAKILNLDQASFGDMPINKAFKDRIIIDNSDIYGIDLPYTTTEDGRIIPDFDLLGKIRQADNTVLQQGLSPNNPSDIAKINKIYTDANLPVKYALDGSGNITLTGNYKRFAAVQATADEKALLGDFSISDKTFEIVDDEMEIDKFKEAMKSITGQKEYSLDKPWWFTGDRHIIKGTIFIPITGSATDARTASSKGKLTGGTTDLDTLREKWHVRQNYNNSAASINLTQ